ncbi:MAG TPA: sodium:proton antiporter [Candidatus Binataceae bacterium]|nr:sodium:proton antiporter [Candidatus Binataceae bacterium]
MSFDIIAILITITAIFSFLNVRYFKLPSTIGVLAIALIFSALVIVAGKAGVPSADIAAAGFLRHIDFNRVLLHGLLAYLLFAGGLNLKIPQLSDQKGAIALLSTLGVAISTLVVAGGTWLVLGLVGMPIPPVAALLFGALISPTDPIAVLAILRTLAIPSGIQAQIGGESIFNDGVGAVVFMVLLQIATSPVHVGALEAVKLLATEAVGGIVFGLAAGLLTYWLLVQVDNYKVEILLTLGLASGGYALADRIGVSAPIAIVVAGLLIGNEGREKAMSDETRSHLDVFWEVVDEILNAILFLLIGAELLLVPLNSGYGIAALVAVPLVLIARLVSVATVVLILSPFRKFEHGTIAVLTWSGLRGGISVALALSVPYLAYRNSIIAMTYAVVIFSIIVQGLTIRSVILRTIPSLQLASEPTATSP